MGPLAVDISHKYTQLARDTSGASAAASNADVSARLRTGVQELGRACADIVRAAGTCQMSPGDAYAQREVAEHSKIVTEKVSQVLAALQAGSRGTQACINAASTVSGIIGDLDTTIMFATAGTLHAENENDTFADHREHILQTAKALVEDTKTLVAGAASSQEQLAVAAQNAVSTIVQLAEVVKYGAASLGSQNPEAQVMLINAVKDVASALGDLIHATKAASGKPISDPSMEHLKDSAKVTRVRTFPRFTSNCLTDAGDSLTVKMELITCALSLSLQINPAGCAWLKKVHCLQRNDRQIFVAVFCVALYLDGAILSGRTD